MRLIEVIATMQAPLVVTDDLHLDDLLTSAHPLYRQQHVTRQTAMETFAEPPIPVMAVTFGGARVRLCSSAQYTEQALLGSTRVVKRRDSEDLAQLARPIHLALGPGKNRLGRLPIVTSATLRWLAVGDRRGVLRLLQRLTHLGGWRSAGYGFVASWAVVEMSVDASEVVLVQHGVAQRNLPAAWVTTASGYADGPIAAPYWHPGRRHERLVPAGTHCELKPAVIQAVRVASDPEQAARHRMRHRVRNAEAALRRAQQTGAPLSNRVQRVLSRPTLADAGVDVSS